LRGLPGPSAVAVSGNYAYVANYAPAGLQLVDISDARRPILVGGSSSIRYGTGVVVSGDNVYVPIGLNGLAIFDTAPPPALPRLSLTPLSFHDQRGFRFRIEGLAGMPVDIERSSDLMHWENWFTTVLGDDPLELLDVSGTVKTHQFYRVLAK
jgi:hypothetical protein